jgi:DNA primase
VSFAPNQDTKEQVRQAIDIVELVGSYFPLRRQGRIFVGLCPWHDDTRPSLQVNPERQSWKCWVCNVGGDVFSFVMKREGVDFREALQMLADRAGIVLTGPSRAAPATPGSPSDKRTLFEATAWAERQFRECLAKSTEAESARRYLADRGIDQARCTAFHLGFSPDRWQWLLDRARSTSYSPAVLEAAGLAARGESGRHYDFFRGRVLFSIRDPQNRPIGFGGRVLPGSEDPRKYVNSRDTRLFSKSEHVYGLDVARDEITRTRRVVVVEGYTDVIMAHQMGLQNFVAVLGTALGPGHVRLLRRYADSITLLLDGDEAGKRRTNEVLELFIESDVDLRVLTLPAGLDPCDFLTQHGARALNDRLDTAVDALEHAVVVQTQGIDLTRDTHRANQALERVLSILAKAPRTSSEGASAKLLRERQMLARLAREFAVEESVLRTRISDLRRAAPRARAATEAQPDAAPLTLQELDPHDAELLEILARHPELVDAVLLELTAEQLSSPAARAIFEIYRQLGDQGLACEFGRVLAEMEDPQLKHLFVELDERAQSKEGFASEDAPARLRHLVSDIRYRSQAAERRRQQAALEQRSVDEQEEIDLLRKLYEQQRQRQGLSAPTDG